MHALQRFAGACKFPISKPLSLLCALSSVAPYCAAVVSEWCLFHALIRVTPELRVDPDMVLAWRRSAAQAAGKCRDVAKAWGQRTGAIPASEQIRLYFAKGERKGHKHQVL
jgi:hypothetical protein